MYKRFVDGKYNLLLAMAVVLCGLAVVHTQHQSRTLVLEHEGSIARGKALRADWDQLKLEREFLASSERVEGIASAKLGMVRIASAETRYLNVGPSK